MNSDMTIEMIGYFGSVLVLVSFLMVSVVKLRLVNSLGGLIFAIYAVMIHSYPTALMNFCLVGINIFYLVRLKNTERHYDLVPGEIEDEMVHYLLSYYAEDIKRCFPGLQWEKHPVNAVYIVCNDTAPAGLLLGRRGENGDLEIVLDYSAPAYRDCSVGKYLYAELQKAGVQKLIYAESHQRHEPYLKKMGFVRENGVFVKKLSKGA